MKAQQIIDYLERVGMVEVETNSTKYRKFKGGYTHSGYFWVGKAGAVRFGETLTDSVSMTAFIKGQIEKRRLQNDRTLST